MTQRTKGFMYTFIILSIMIGIGLGYLLQLFDKTKDIVGDAHENIGRHEEISPLRTDKVDPVVDNVSVLFIGLDTSEHRNFGENSRSDALLLATFNKKDHSVKLLSIPRDTYVYIPELGYSTKINHAHFYGGPKASVETIENFLNIPVDYFVRMNFNGFVDAVDVLGGVMYDVPFSISESDSDDNKNRIKLEPGMQRLNGEEALAIARTRKYDDDVERGKRQQELLKAIADKATSLSSFFKLENLLDVVGENMNTNLTFDEMKGFISYGMEENIRIHTINFEGKGVYMNDGGWYYQVDEDSRKKVQNELRHHLGIQDDQNQTPDNL